MEPDGEPDWGALYPGLVFSKRRCLICNEAVEANHFGRHVASHAPAELATWPGGAAGILQSLLGSVETSIAEARGYPEVLLHLRASRNVLKRTLRRAKKGEN